MRRRWLFLLLLLLVLTPACARRPQFLEREITLGEETYRYRVWLPPRYTKVHHWPVVLYLHGSGERGDDNVSQVSTGLGPALERYAERYKCVVVFPQARAGQEWYGDMELQAMAALDRSVREFHGDPARIYLTGVSMGGAGAWYMARHGHKFAAVVPVCGEVTRPADEPFPVDPPPDVARIAGAADPYAALAGAIGRTPVWAFHGANDAIVSSGQSRSMVAALQKAGGRVRYTEYPNEGHEIWDLVYSDREMVHWLLSQRLGR